MPEFFNSTYNARQQHNTGDDEQFDENMMKWDDFIIKKIKFWAIRV